jgi:hypothetical protein
VTAGRRHAPEARIRAACRLQPDDWRGDDAVQWMVAHRGPIAVDWARCGFG